MLKDFYVHKENHNKFIKWRPWGVWVLKFSNFPKAIIDGHAHRDSPGVLSVTTNTAPIPFSSFLTFLLPPPSVFTSELPSVLTEKEKGGAQPHWGSRSEQRQTQTHSTPAFHVSKLKCHSYSRYKWAFLRATCNAMLQFLLPLVQHQILPPYNPSWIWWSVCHQIYKSSYSIKSMQNPSFDNSSGGSTYVYQKLETTIAD